MNMNPPPESSERCFKLDVLITGAKDEAMREAMLNTIELVLTEHIEQTIESWNRRKDATVSHLFDT